MGWHFPGSRRKTACALFSPKDNNPKKSFAQDRIITSDKGRIECAAFGPWRLAISSQNRTLTVMEFGLNSESNLQGKIMRGHTGTVGGIRFGEGREGPNSLLAFNSHSYGRNALTVWGHDFGSPRKPFFDFESQNARRKERAATRSVAAFAETETETDEYFRPLGIPRDG